VFDGENRIKTAGSVTYTYDADGRRIQKSSGTNYWYGPGSQVFAETDSSGNWTNYIFFGGQRLARNVNGDIKYYITDHLHSTAMFVDKAGTTAAILDDNDMYPWGGVVPGVGKTTSNNTVKFTGKYRDTDTAANLDYFGARYYSNTIGRFMSPDWAAAPTNVPYAKFGDPQSLNLYSYTENGPINRIDGDGHMIVGFTGSGVFGVKGTGVDDGSGGFSDGDNPYADADRALWATSLGAIVVVQSPGTGSSSTDAAASQSQPAQPQSAPTQSTAQAQATQAQPTTQQQPASAQPNGQARHGSWEYSQSTGQMTHVLPDGTRVNVGQGYSGHGQGLNTPQAQNQSNTGPIPQGTWHIDHQQDNITGAGHKLPASMRLDPAPGTTTRGGFLIHGDNARRDHSASNGCIILNKDIRNQIGRSGDNMLRVVP
jgi:RHS repeat-associated protein